MIYKEYKHNPPHLFVKNEKYFITASTYQKKKFFIQKEAKEYLKNSIIRAFSEFKWQIDDWVILDNHYHLMVESTDTPVELVEIIRRIHRFSAIWLKKNFTEYNALGRIWYNYWDTCVSFEKSYFNRLNYIWFNPVKHGYVEFPEEWEFGSYFTRAREDDKAMQKIINQYRIDQMKIKDDF
ncbi:MAG: hypothetical protein HN729_02930 [Candidatus Marinimicrobia bacterium]|jgi:putative transposase|nr:hypothetical protein [Candidatus Neomarinimicrobiota bacterium]MBT3632938.1 hypothetical protein [Candidatus Neomarinimicrobiota bacterium]MBT3682048.1 hypothetical protein [Candidatus Neomarinimicrobiota bacterium]MBT3758923.1 hypothetical protein [Candidatus Neomarinimicrobiota bacterium]MBT3895178.1 hypothetical protein [Candidatus Neomarinimicrobiota bacterium]